MNLFRARAIAHGVDPDAYVAPPEGEAIYERIEIIDDFDELVAYAAGSLDHFGQLLDTYAAGAEGEDAATIADRRRRQRPRPAAPRRADGMAAAAQRRELDAHELYRRRELVETGTLCRLEPDPSPPAASRRCAPSCRAARRARGASRRCRSRRGRAPACRRARGSAIATASTPVRSWRTSTPTGRSGARRSAGGWTAGCWIARPARRSATSAASPRTAVLEAIDAAGPTPSSRTSPRARARTCCTRSSSAPAPRPCCGTSTPARSSRRPRPPASSACRTA